MRDYPFQWFWDSCFHAIVWSRFDPERAADELRGLLAVQERDGLIPHVVFWKERPRLAAPVAPPREPNDRTGSVPPHAAHDGADAAAVLAQAVERVVEAGADGVPERGTPSPRALLPLPRRASRPGRRRADLDRLPVRERARLQPRLRRGDRRSTGHAGRALPPHAAPAAPEQAGELRRAGDLPSVRPPPGGRAGQRGLRPGPPCACAAGRAGRSRGGCAVGGRTADAVTASLLERCWDERLGLFVNLAGADERRSRVKTIHGLMPLSSPISRRRSPIGWSSTWDDPRTFAAPFPVPSVALDEPTFLRDHRVRGFRFIWRGPLSLNTNWFLVHGPRATATRTCRPGSRVAPARGGRARWLQRVLRPARRRPVGAERFGWATLVVDL